MDLTPHRSVLRHLTRTDPDARVRHRADALLLGANGLSLTKHLGCSRNSLRRGAQRFVAEGRDGLGDRRRLGTMVTIFPDDWSEDAQATYDATSLADVTARMAAIVLEQMGQQVVFDDTPVPDVIEVRTVDYVGILHADLNNRDSFVFER